MSTTETPAAPDTKQKNLPPLPAPYQVEMGDDKCRTISLDHLRLRLRGRWSRSNFKRDLGILNNMPDIPGLVVAINPKRSQLRIYDPLEEDPKLLAQINAVATSGEGVMIKSIFAKFVHVPAVEHKLDEDTLVSLMLEVARKHYGPSPCMMEVRGSGRIPSEEEIKDLQACGALKGRELFDPWSNSQDKPRFADDLKNFMDKWDKLMMMGRAMGQGQ